MSNNGQIRLYTPEELGRTNLILGGIRPDRRVHVRVYCLNIHQSVVRMPYVFPKCFTETFRNSTSNNSTAQENE